MQENLIFMQSLLAKIKTGAKAELKKCVTKLCDRLDLPTREDFDIQKKVLQNTRAKVDALEKTLKQ